MKKLAFVFAAVVAVSFASCGNKTAENTSNVDSDSVAVVEEDCCTESDTCCAEADSCCADSAEAPVAE